jgi:hypothetical protein
MASIAWSSYERSNSDPYKRGAVADPRKRAELAYLSTQPVLLAPILNALFRGVYVAYKQVLECFVWIGYTVGEYLQTFFE